MNDLKQYIFYTPVKIYAENEVKKALNAESRTVPHLTDVEGFESYIQSCIRNSQYLLLAGIKLYDTGIPVEKYTFCLNPSPEFHGENHYIKLSLKLYEDEMKAAGLEINEADIKEYTQKCCESWLNQKNLFFSVPQFDNMEILPAGLNYVTGKWNKENLLLMESQMRKQIGDMQWFCDEIKRHTPVGTGANFSYVELLSEDGDRYCDFLAGIIDSVESLEETALYLEFTSDLPEADCIGVHSKSYSFGAGEVTDAPDEVLDLLREAGEDILVQPELEIIEENRFMALVDIDEQLLPDFY